MGIFKGSERVRSESNAQSCGAGSRRDNDRLGLQAPSFREPPMPRWDGVPSRAAFDAFPASGFCPCSRSVLSSRRLRHDICCVHRKSSFTFDAFVETDPKNSTRSTGVVTWRLFLGLQHFSLPASYTGHCAIKSWHHQSSRKSLKIHPSSFTACHCP